MRRSLIALTVTSILTLACGGAMNTPNYPREERRFSDHEVPTEMASMDLPWYGGLINRSSDHSMTVSYSRPYDGVDPDQLREWWPAALEAEGWAEKTRNLSGNGTLDLTYQLPDERTALMSIQPEGTLWWVYISINP